MTFIANHLFGVLLISFVAYSAMYVTVINVLAYVVLKGRAVTPPYRYFRKFNKNVIKNCGSRRKRKFYIAANVVTTVFNILFAALVFLLFAVVMYF